MVYGVDTPEGINIYFQIGQSDIGARLERCSITSCSWIEKVYGGKDGVRIDSGATAACICGVVPTGGVSVGLNGRSINKAIEGWHMESTPAGNTRYFALGQRNQECSDQAWRRGQHLASMP